MTYETMDWEGEARRISLAFGVRGTCRFRPTRIQMNPAMELYKPRIWPFKAVIQCESGVRLNVNYRPDGRYFSCKNQSGDEAVASVDWSDFPQPYFEHGEAPRQEIAEGLFYLQLLSAELEEVLGFDLSAHERIELLRQFDERLRKQLS